MNSLMGGHIFSEVVIFLIRLYNGNYLQLIIGLTGAILDTQKQFYRVSSGTPAL